MARVIDKMPVPKETRPTKVIVLSRSRVGTTSLYTALNMLGYKPFHSKQVFDVDDTTNMKVFEEALRSKYLDDSAKPYGKAEFDKWFAQHDAIMTAPQYFFDEFLEFYPDAKFIITDRDADAWVKSLNNTVCRLLDMVKSFPLTFFKRIDPWISAFCSLNCTLERVVFHDKGSVHGIEDAREDFIQRQQQIQCLGPRPNVAVFRLEDGFSWDKLCSFLGHNIPDQPYPNSYNQEGFHTRWASVLHPKMWAATRRLFMFAVPAFAGLYAAYYMQ